MNQLENIKASHLQSLNKKLEELKSKGEALSVELNGMKPNIVNNIEQSLKEITETLNKNFISDINKQEIENNFSDDERMACYKSFRDECANIISTFNQEILSPLTNLTNLMNK